MPVVLFIYCLTKNAEIISNIFPVFTCTGSEVNICFGVIRGDQGIWVYDIKEVNKQKNKKCLP